MRAMDRTPGITIGIVGLVGLYTLLATVAGTASVLGSRFDEMYQSTPSATWLTPGAVLAAWVATLLVVLTITLSQDRIEAFLSQWVIHAFMTVGWVLAAFAAFSPFWRCHLTLT